MKWLFALALAACVQARVFVEIKPNTNECFNEVAVTQSLRGSFEVLEDSSIELSISLAGQVVHSIDQAKTGDLDISRGPGEYQVCFHNTANRQHKIVAFSLHGGLGDSLEDEDVVKHEEHLQPVKHALDQLAFQIKKLQEHERYLGERMHRHIKTAESTSLRVFVYTAVEALVLLCVNLLQVWYMKRYFETKRRM